MTTGELRPVAKVVEAGPFTTIQDSGRFGYRRFGVPASGALDLISLVRANLLLGNEPGSPALEVIHGPIEIAAADHIRVGHAGSPAAASIDGRSVDDNPLEIQAGSRLRLEPSAESTTTYLAFAGGLGTEVVMGSSSTNTRARIGGLGGRTLQAGDVLFGSRRPAGPSRRTTVPGFEIPETHRAVRGLHADLFPPESLAAFFESEFRISYASDRMGYRLEGRALGGFGEWGNVLTFPVFPGMVQVTPDGLPIVLMADCQTTGGYPVIAVVLAPDLCALAQKPPGGRVSFREVSDDESHSILERFSLETGLGRKTNG